MKTGRKILIAFILNLAFSVFEFMGGIFTGSVAIVSDAVHDIADAASIGISYFLEKKSKKAPDETYTFGYARYSVVGGVITILILLFGSVAVIFNAVKRMIEPAKINYNGMILFAIIGTCVNLCATFLTREGESLNQKAVNLHMLEDVLGWVIVLVGAVVMRFTDFSLIDPIMSVGVAIFILVNAVQNLKEACSILLERAPNSIDVSQIRTRISEIDGVLDVHHLRIWSLDGQSNYAAMHITTDSVPCQIKEKVREQLQKHGITHTTLELKTPDEQESEEPRHTAVTNLFSAHHHH